MKIKNILLFVTLFGISLIWAQKTEKKEEKERKIFFGGGIQLNFSNYYTTIGLSPSAIYEISDKFAVGFGASYTYIKYKSTDVRYNLIGFRSLALYDPIKQLQLSTEFEELNIGVKYHDNSKNNYWNPALYLGLALKIGRRASAGLRYDVLYNEEKSIYRSPLTPFVRIHF